MWTNNVAVGWQACWHVLTDTITYILEFSITQSHSDIWAQCLQMVSMRHNRAKPNLGCSPVCFLAVLEPWAVSGTGGMSQDTYFSHVCQILAAFVEWKYLKAIFISMFLKTFFRKLCVSQPMTTSNIHHGSYQMIGTTNKNQRHKYGVFVSLRDLNCFW